MRSRITRGAFICEERRASCASSPIATSCCSCPAWIRSCSATASIITEQTQAEEELDALMRQHQSILDSVGDGIWGMDMEGTAHLRQSQRGRYAGLFSAGVAGTGHACRWFIIRTQRSRRTWCRNAPIFGSLKRETPCIRQRRCLLAQRRTIVPRRICGLPAAGQGPRGRHCRRFQGRYGTAKPGSDEGRIHLHGQPRTTHAAHFAASRAGPDCRRRTGKASGEGSANARYRLEQLRPAGSPGQ